MDILDYDIRMKNEQFTDTRVLTLPKGGIFEIKMTQTLIDNIRLHFDLSTDQYVEDDHIRMFVFGVVKNAIDNAEREVYIGKEQFTG